MPCDTVYEQWTLLKKNIAAVALGLTAGVITSLVTVLVLSVLMGLSHEDYVTLLPKSITTAIGMGCIRGARRICEPLLSQLSS